MVHQSVRGAIEARDPACGPSVPYHDARGGLCRGGFGQPAPRDRLVVACESHFADGKEGRPTVLIHPADARRLGIAEGDLVQLGNGRGSVRLHAEMRAGQQPGVLVVESIWPNAAFRDGIGINALISAYAAPPNGGAVFHDTAVWLHKEPVVAKARTAAAELVPA